MCRRDASPQSTGTRRCDDRVGRQQRDPAVANDVRLVPVLDLLRPLAGQPALARAPVRQLAADGSAQPYDQRACYRLADDPEAWVTR